MFRGIDERLNYIPYNDSLIDLRFGIPFKFFKGLKFDHKLHNNRNQRVVSSNTKECLIQNKIFLPYSLFDLLYFKRLS